MSDFARARLTVESLEIRDTPAAPDLYLNIWVNQTEIPAMAREAADSALMGEVKSDTESLDDLVGSEFVLCDAQTRNLSNNLKQIGLGFHHYES